MPTLENSVVLGTDCAEICKNGLFTRAAGWFGAPHPHLCRESQARLAFLMGAYAASNQNETC